jgi:hypothetical protein
MTIHDLQTLLTPSGVALLVENSPVSLISLQREHFRFPHNPQWVAWPPLAMKMLLHAQHLRLMGMLLYRRQREIMV